MEKEFVPYELAKELKELGFNEPCLSHYISKKGELNFSEDAIGVTQEILICDAVIAPLYQQAFRWLYKQIDRDGFGVMALDNDKALKELKNLIEILKIKKKLKIRKFTEE